jgi:hypothetical protein
MVEHTYLGNFPDERQDVWTEECQGVAHDDSYWYITQKSSVWRAPVWKDLRTPFHDGDDGVIRRSIPVAGYDHMGDADVSNGVLFVPLEGKRRVLWFSVDRKPRIATFSTPDLRYLWSDELGAQSKGGWCAVDSRGRLFSSNGRLSARDPLYCYEIEDSGVRLVGRVTLLDEGGEPVDLDLMQGGTFADDDHLYLSCGYYKGFDASWGLHLFDLRSRRRIARSTNGSGTFNYEFHPTRGVSGFAEEPEGITWWDLDRPRAPGIGGQLHAILLDNDANGDDVYFKHYRVDGL